MQQLKHRIGLLQLMVGNRPPAKIPIPVPPSRLAKSNEPRSHPLQLNEQGQILEAAIEAAANAILKS
ncbi:hypothetical protein Lalb_Chr14g0370491 [Lupinus albus]|uniref:Uncharacterized protein n=1 Tax=Lupinus albus TaxID=3870 RepID=A0A6A4PFF0_LUPAL|nr:hypothetical protein Lalb_Chr14g0370491 [Lupinus albus]